MSSLKRKIVLSVFMLLVFVQTNAQCAMCRAVLESEEGQSTAEGVNDGIVYLMAIPYILVAAIGYIIYKSFNKTEKAENN